MVVEAHLDQGGRPSPATIQPPEPWHTNSMSWQGQPQPPQGHYVSQPYPHPSQHHSIHHPPPHQAHYNHGPPLPPMAAPMHWHVHPPPTTAAAFPPPPPAHSVAVGSYPPLPPPGYYPAYPPPMYYVPAPPPPPLPEASAPTRGHKYPGKHVRPLPEMYAAPPPSHALPNPCAPLLSYNHGRPLPPSELCVPSLTSPVRKRQRRCHDPWGTLKDLQNQLRLAPLPDAKMVRYSQMNQEWRARLHEMRLLRNTTTRRGGKTLSLL